MSIISFLDILGTFAFAHTAAILASKKGLDPFGMLVLSFVTATGGGTIRDMILDRPVFWLHNSQIIYWILFSFFSAVIFYRIEFKFRRLIFLLDTLGLGAFTVIGVEAGINAEVSLPAAVIMGLMTGVFGGILRDIIISEIPIILKREIYATASLVGGALYIVLLQFGVEKIWSALATLAVVSLVRFSAVFYNLAIPNLEERWVKSE